MKRVFSKQTALAAILIAAFLLRVWGVGHQDILGDEAADSFRAVGYIDYLGTSFQTQPIEWYKDQAQLPFWTKFSFHDLPPLAIAVQHCFFVLFGDSIFVARLPAVLLGTLSAYLIYLIARRLFGESAGLWSALAFAIGGAASWIFRTSLLEPVLLFFMIWNLYALVRFTEERRWWWLFGVTLSGVLLTKYTGILLLPIYIVFLLIYQRSYFREWRWYAGLGLSMLIFTPVIIYNVGMYKARGHFDLQFAYLLGQNTPEWTGLVGKIQSPFREIWSNLKTVYGIAELLLTAFGIFVSAVMWRLRRQRGYLLIGLYLLCTTLLLVKIGSAQRFLALYVPAFALLQGLALQELWNRRGLIWLTWLLRCGAVAALLAIVFHSVTKNIITYPNYGVASLDVYFEKEFAGKISAVTPQTDTNPHLQEVINRFSADKNPDKNSRGFFWIVYNDNIALPTLEWVFYRRFFYHSIPTMYIENFQRILAQYGPNYFKNFTVYFVQSTDNTLLNEFKKEKTSGQWMENILLEGGYKPSQIIYGQQQLPMFKIYKFTLGG